MLQLKNETPFRAGMALCPDPAGADTLYVTVRAAFDLCGPAPIVGEQPEVRAADEYWGEPGTSSLKYAGEIHLGKPSTDVALVGDAWAPHGRAVAQLDVTITLGRVRKVMRVSGDREWTPGGRISSPTPFVRMPLVYERAFGGLLDGAEGAPRFELRNPVGLGPVGTPGAPHRLPNLEDPRALITRLGDRPAPVGFGFIAPSWEPRRSAAGTYDEAWQTRRAPYLPRDFQPRFFNAAHPDLVCDGYLEGGEPVELANLSPTPIAPFRLPRCDLDLAVTIGRRIERPSLHLETVLIEPGDRRLSIVWRASVRAGKHPLSVRAAELRLLRLDLQGKAA